MPGRWSGWQNAICFKVFFVCARERGGGFVVLTDQIAAECAVGLLEVAKNGGNMLAMVP
jgi:hypothetical protein